MSKLPRQVLEHFQNMNMISTNTFIHETPRSSRPAPQKHFAVERLLRIQHVTFSTRVLPQHLERSQVHRIQTPDLHRQRVDVLAVHGQDKLAPLGGDPVKETRALRWAVVVHKHANTTRCAECVRGPLVAPAVLQRVLLAVNTDLVFCRVGQYLGGLLSGQFGVIFLG